MGHEEAEEDGPRIRESPTTVAAGRKTTPKKMSLRRRPTGSTLDKREFAGRAKVRVLGEIQVKELKGKEVIEEATETQTIEAPSVMTRSMML